MKIAMIRKAGAIKRIPRRCRLRRLLPWVWAVVTICSGCARFVSTCIFQLLSQGWIADTQGGGKQGDRKGRPYHTRLGISVVYSRGGACPRPACGRQDLYTLRSLLDIARSCNACDILGEGTHRVRR